MKAFTTFVRPTLEYCSNVWCPFRKADIDKIKSVQRRFTKRLVGLQELQYSERLVCLKQDSLELRRLKSDLYMYFKIINNLVDLSVDNFFTFRSGVTRGNGLSLFKRRFSSNSERYFFQNRCINAWNLLPDNVVHSSSIAIFKYHLDSIDFSTFLRYGPDS